MRDEPIQALRTASRQPPGVAAGPTLLSAGATGSRGNEMLWRLAGSGGHGPVQLLAREPITQGLRGIACMLLPKGLDASCRC